MRARPRWSVLALVALAAAGFSQRSFAAEPTVADSSPDYAWSVTVEAGPAFVLLEGTSFDRQVRAFGYDFGGGGWGAALLVEKAVLDWLVVGGELALTRFTTSRDDRGTTDAEMSLTRLSGLAYARTALCIAPRCTPSERLDFGAQLGVGTGGTFWALSGDVESTAHFTVELALVWQLLVDHWGVGLRLAHAWVFEGALGPLSLDTGFQWAPRLGAQVLYRW